MFKMEISSRNVVEGTARAPHRAMYKAMGLTDDDLSKPFVGVCHTGNEATPCNIHLPGLAQKAKDGVKDAGATILGGCCEIRPSHIRKIANLKN